MPQLRHRRDERRVLDVAFHLCPTSPLRQTERARIPVAVRRKVADALASAARGEASAQPHSAAQESPRVANLTNWATVYSHLSLPDCKHVAHVPVVDSAKDVFDNNLYVFRPRPGELAVLYFGGGERGLRAS